jgi:predicted RNA-binding protein Jag
MAVEITKLTVKCEDEERNIFFIHLETTDSKILIWTHGQTLESTKHLLSRMIENSIESWITIHLEINDYLKSKDDKLFRYVDSKIDYVVKSQKEIVLPNFSSYERKKIHNYISEKKLDTIRSYSDWEWKDRIMHLAPSGKTSSNINIDIDWIDI